VNIQEKLEWLRNMNGTELRGYTIRFFEEHRGQRIQSIRWDRWELNELLDMYECLGGPSIAVICDRLSRDWVYFSSGMPDLFLWNKEKKAARIIEVKSQNDRLSEKQKFWLHYMTTNGINACVCYVEPAKMKKKQKKKKRRRRVRT